MLDSLEAQTGTPAGREQSPSCQPSFPHLPPPGADRAKSTHRFAPGTPQPQPSRPSTRPAQTNRCTAPCNRCRAGPDGGSYRQRVGVQPPERPQGGVLSWARTGQRDLRAHHSRSPVYRESKVNSAPVGQHSQEHRRGWGLTGPSPGAHLSWAGRCSPEGSSERRLFLATSANAPKPRPTARPAKRRLRARGCPPLLHPQCTGGPTQTPTSAPLGPSLTLRHFQKGGNR